MLIELSLLADLATAFSGATPEQEMLFVSLKPSSGLQAAAISRNKLSHKQHMQLRPKQKPLTIAWSLGGRSLLRWRGLLQRCLCRPPSRPAVQLTCLRHFFATLALCNPIAQC